MNGWRRIAVGECSPGNHRQALLVAMLAPLLWSCASSSAGNAARTTVSIAPETSTASTANSNAPADEERFWRIGDVVDGDTLYVVGALGELKVRVIGINTPEKGECFSGEASEALAQLVKDEDLVLVTDRSDVDQYGRALRYVETVDGLDIGAQMIATGFAIARRYPPDDSRAVSYADLQRTARREERGLWAPDACGAGAGDTEAVDIAIEINADAPGDDSVNLNGEWVRFTNVGTTAVDLDGWQVADESSSHRYSFSDLRLDVGADVTLFSGCGPDSELARYWCVSGSAVWNNSGDTVFLRDTKGNIAVSSSYGKSG